jgi:hypothetical protein
MLTQRAPAHPAARKIIPAVVRLLLGRPGDH